MAEKKYETRGYCTAPRASVSDTAGVVYASYSAFVFPILFRAILDAAERRLLDSRQG